MHMDDLLDRNKYKSFEVGKQIIYQTRDLTFNYFGWKQVHQLLLKFAKIMETHAAWFEMTNQSNNVHR